MKLPCILGIAHIAHVVASGHVSSSSTDESQSRMITMPLIPHHVQRLRRLEAGGEDPFTLKADALYQGYGTHYVDLWVGSPPQRQTLIIDTGSSVTAFPCSDCTNCGSGYHIDDYFQEKDSATCVEVDCLDCTIGHCSSSSQCELSVSYQEGSSWNAYEVKDIAYTGGPHSTGIDHAPHAFEFHFGCQTHLTGLFKTQLADGIAGMEMSDSSLWKQAYQGGVIHSKAFSLCFSRQPTASKDGTAAGIMTLGGSDVRLHSTTMVYANQPNDAGWFSVHVRAIYLRRGGGESVLSNNPKARIEMLTGVTETQINNGEIIVDSGTTDTYLSMYLAGPFRAAYSAIMDGDNWDPDTPVSLSKKELMDMPTILFQLQGWAGETGDIDPMAQGLAGAVDSLHPQDVMVAIPPSHYMEYSAKTQKYVPRFYFTEARGGVLGANFMMGHDIFFDVDNYRLGFAESNCDYQVVADLQESGR